MKIPPPPAEEEVLPPKRACDLLIFGWLGILTESAEPTARNLAVAPPLNSPEDGADSSVGLSEPNKADFPNNTVGGGLENREGTACWTGIFGVSSFSSNTGVFGLVPADLATLDCGEPNSPEPPWKSPLLVLVSDFPNRDLTGSADGFPNNGAAEPNILEPEAPGSALLLLGANKPKEEK